MLGNSGIGTYFLSVLPYFLDSFDCLLFGNANLINGILTKTSNTKNNLEILNCDIKTFSVSEIINFPKDLLKKINSCDAYYTPYCNIPCHIKIPVFSTIHDIVFLDIKGLSSKIGTIIRKYFYQRAINKSKVIFTVSQFSADRIKYHLKTKNKQIIVTYNSVPEWFINKTENKIEQKSNLLFVGNIKRHKGLHILIPAFKKALEKGLNAKLFIVGNSENFRTSDSLIKNEISECKDIIFTGKITDDELLQLYNKSSLLIQPSLYEGFGMPPLEALTCRTNVILSDIPVFKEIYNNFPVTFFESENVDDLAEKILYKYNSEPPCNIPQKYSFATTSKIIINTIINYI